METSRKVLPPNIGRNLAAELLVGGSGASNQELSRYAAWSVLDVDQGVDFEAAANSGFRLLHDAVGVVRVEPESGMDEIWSGHLSAP